MRQSIFIGVIATVAGSAAFGGVMDKERGIHVGQRLTIQPYVAMSYTYDSNIDSSKRSKAGSMWIVNPGANAVYKDDNWSVAGQVWYQYHGYNKYTHQLNESSYGESLAANWANSAPNEKGWKLSISERFEQIAQDDDMTNSGGRGIGRDRKQFNINGSIERRINQRLHADVNAGYYYLDYDNNVNSYAGMYGWRRANAGLELGYMASPWTDFLLSFQHQWYEQDNNRDLNYGDIHGRHISSDSEGWSVMAGIGTRATERIQYRAMLGWSRFEYADGLSTSNGWTYELSGSWRITDTLSTMIMGSSYYQPSETEFATAIKVYGLSWGVAKSLVRGKVTLTGDLAFRREAHEYSMFDAGNYDENITTARIGVNYMLNRFIDIYCRAEYQLSDVSGDNGRGKDYDYDRFRGTVGMRLTY